MAVSNNTAVSGSLRVASNAAGYNSSMESPNNSVIGSPSAGDALIPNDRCELEQRLRKVHVKINYFTNEL